MGIPKLTASVRDKNTICFTQLHNINRSYLVYNTRFWKSNYFYPVAVVVYVSSVFDSLVVVNLILDILYIIQLKCHSPDRDPSRLDMMKTREAAILIGHTMIITRNDQEDGRVGFVGKKSVATMGNLGMKTELA